MECELTFVDPDNGFIPDTVVTKRFWDAMLFRPDMAPKVVQLMRSDDFKLTRAAQILQEAVNDAKWPQDMW